eukprot:1653158-Rhodomonas_salina.1
MLELYRGDLRPPYSRLSPGVAADVLRCACSPTPSRKQHGPNDNRNLHRPPQETTFPPAHLIMQGRGLTGVRLWASKVMKGVAPEPSARKS